MLIRDAVKPILEANGTTVSEFCQSVLTYVAETRKIPVKKQSLTKKMTS
ncbi:MAG: type II toxin-antitoxin system RelB/DinJ family antitoxin [Burkholderiaceae bacterium]|nr:type II toxin-antitoxin system RelB/DinJ family antitoxin [Burkholderiaceae bacterium]